MGAGESLATSSTLIAIFPNTAILTTVLQNYYNCIINLPARKEPNKFLKKGAWGGGGGAGGAPKEGQHKRALGNEGSVSSSGNGSSSGSVSSSGNPLGDGDPTAPSRTMKETDAKNGDPTAPSRKNSMKETDAKIDHYLERMRDGFERNLAWNVGGDKIIGLADELREDLLNQEENVSSGGRGSSNAGSNASGLANAGQRSVSSSMDKDAERRESALRSLTGGTPDGGGTTPDETGTSAVSLFYSETSDGTTSDGRGNKSRSKNVSRGRGSTGASPSSSTRRGRAHSPSGAASSSPKRKKRSSSAKKVARRSAASATSFWFHTGDGADGLLASESSFDDLGRQAMPSEAAEDDFWFQTGDSHNLASAPQHHDHTAHSTSRSTGRDYYVGSRAGLSPASRAKVRKMGEYWTRTNAQELPPATADGTTGFCGVGGSFPPVVSIGRAGEGEQAEAVVSSSSPSDEGVRAVTGTSSGSAEEKESSAGSGLHDEQSEEFFPRPREEEHSRKRTGVVPRSFAAEPPEPPGRPQPPAGAPPPAPSAIRKRESMSQWYLDRLEKARQRAAQQRIKSAQYDADPTSSVGGIANPSTTTTGGPAPNYRFFYSEQHSNTQSGEASGSSEEKVDDAATRSAARLGDVSRSSPRLSMQGFVQGLFSTAEQSSSSSSTRNNVDLAQPSENDTCPAKATPVGPHPPAQRKRHLSDLNRLPPAQRKRHLSDLIDRRHGVENGYGAGDIK